MSDERLEKLVILKTIRNEAYQKMCEQKRTALQVFYKFLNGLNEGGAPLLQPKEEGYFDIRYYSLNRDWEIYHEVYFQNQDPSRDRNYDFGSSFTVRITNKEIKINHGSCGEWGKEDVCQYSRLGLIKHILDNEQTIIQNINSIINPVDFDTFYKTDREIDQIEYEIQNEKREKERWEIKSKIKSGKYLCSMSYNTSYPNGYDNPGVKTYWFHHFYKIEKVTDKSVIVHPCYDNDGSCYTWITNRLKLNDIIRDLIGNHQFLLDEYRKTPREDEIANK